MAECDVDLCEVREVHQEKVSEITAKMPEEDELYDLAELFRSEERRVGKECRIGC